MALVVSTLQQQHSATLASGRVVTATLTTTYDGVTVSTLIQLPAVSNLAEGDVIGYQAFVDGLDEIATSMEAIIVYVPV